MEKKITSGEVSTSYTNKEVENRQGVIEEVRKVVSSFALESVTDAFEDEILKDPEHAEKFSQKDVHLDVREEKTQIESGLFFKKEKDATRVVAQASGIIEEKETVE